METLAAGGHLIIRGGDAFRKPDLQVFLRLVEGPRIWSDRLHGASHADCRSPVTISSHRGGDPPRKEQTAGVDPSRPSAGRRISGLIRGHRNCDLPAGRSKDWSPAAGDQGGEVDGEVNSLGKLMRSGLCRGVTVGDGRTRGIWPTDGPSPPLPPPPRRRRRRRRRSGPGWTGLRTGGSGGGAATPPSRRPFSGDGLRDRSVRFDRP